MIKRVLGDASCDKGQIMYLLVNASSPKLLDVAEVHRSHDVDGTGQHFV